uniref:NADH-ubiquinone oxidoreductase chain 2 n=1 Tax=Cryptopsaras couesii TaxID=412659 RepID=A0A6B9IPA7_CRYCE|nr:NADH dehydrogenase subunit 2 [Cryptopsaras couesii]
MSPYILPILCLSLGLGTTLTFMSSHWMLTWMGLEMNTLAILPLLAKRHHPRAIEATIKYFLVQATAAAVLLFTAITNAWLTGEWQLHQVSHPLMSTMVLLALALKVGLAPLHSWLPEVLQGLNLATCLLISTWQKLAPFSVILQLAPTHPAITIMLGMTSILVGGWGGLNQTQLRKVLAYSSIAHLGWMIIVVHLSPNLTLIALLTYLVMTLSVFLALMLNNITSISHLAASWAKTPIMTALMPLIMFSLGGLPPLTGFMPKWLILDELVNQEQPLIAMVAALGSLLSLFFYLRIANAMTFAMAPNTLVTTATWRLRPSGPTSLLSISASLTILMLPSTPIVVALVGF